MLKLDQKYGLLFLVASQAMHSIEEVYFRLWEVFAPARFISGVINSNLELGFIIGNIAVVSFGFICVLLLFRRESAWHKLIVWFWVVLEIVNFSVHTFMAIKTWGYFPGVYTAPLLVLFSVSLLMGATNHAKYHSVT